MNLNHGKYYRSVRNRVMKACVRSFVFFAVLALLFGYVAPVFLRTDISYSSNLVILALPLVCSASVLGAGSALLIAILYLRKIKGYPTWKLKELHDRFIKDGLVSTWRFYE